MNKRPRAQKNPNVETILGKQDPKTAQMVKGSHKQAQPKTQTLSNVYIGAMDTLSWTQYCHSGGPCYSEVWVDTETTLHLYEDAKCEKSAGLVAIYNGGRVRDNSSLLATATTAYLANAPVSLHYINVDEGYSRGHGRLNAVIRLWFTRCTPCGCEGE